jgi:hypothetical protein
MDGREVYQIEYAQCAEDARAAGERSWQVIYIFVGAIGVALTIVAGQLAGRPWREHDGLTLLLTAVAAIVGSALTWAMKRIVERRAWVQRVTYARMRSIEWLLGMRKNIYVHTLDDWARAGRSADWEALSGDERWFLVGVRQPLHRLHRSMEDLDVVRRLACLIIALWWLVFLFEVGVVICNLVTSDGEQASWWCHGVSGRCAR